MGTSVVYVALCLLLLAGRASPLHRSSQPEQRAPSDQTSVWGSSWWTAHEHKQHWVLSWLKLFILFLRLNNKYFFNILQFQCTVGDHGMSVSSKSQVISSFGKLGQVQPKSPSWICVVVSSFIFGHKKISHLKMDYIYFYDKTLCMAKKKVK